LIGLAGIGALALIRTHEPRERQAIRAYVVIAVLGAIALPSPILLVLVLAVLAGYGARALGADRVVSGVGLLCLTGLVSFSSWPIASVPAVPAAYRLLAALPRGPVAEFPIVAESGAIVDQTMALWRSTYHWQPLVNGAGDVVPVDFTAWARTTSGFPDAASFEALRARHVKYIVIRMGDYSADAQARLFARLAPFEKYLRRVTAADDVWLFETVFSDAVG
jgi:hypothetical protein